MAVAASRKMHACITCIILLRYYECAKGKQGRDVCIRNNKLINVSVHSCVNAGAGVFMLSPLEIAYVCPGEQLTLTCATNKSLIGWNITIPHVNGYNSLRLVSSRGVSEITPLRVNSTMFSFTRTSVMPLVVAMAINNVTVDLRVFCTEYSYLMVNTLVTTIRVLRTNSIQGKFHGIENMYACVIDLYNAGYLNPPGMVLTEQLLGMDKVTVILERMVMQDVYSASYTVSIVVVPQVSVVTNSTHIELIVSYNTFYNVGAVATLCGQNSESATIELFYGEYILRLPFNLRPCLQIICVHPFILTTNLSEPHLLLKNGASMHVYQHTVENMTL